MEIAPPYLTPCTVPSVAAPRSLAPPPARLRAPRSAGARWLALAGPFRSRCAGGRGCLFSIRQAFAFQKKSPSRGARAFGSEPRLGGWGCEGSASPPHSACLSRSVLLFQAKDLFRHAPTTQIALDRRELVKAGAASNVVGAGRFSLNDRVRTMIEGVRPPRAPPSIGGDGPHPAFQGSVATGRCDRSCRPYGFPCPTILPSGSVEMTPPRG